ncbi:MAG TPA: PQQ-dependent sugar dehydrogenase, partial [Vicinamibacterales bacterium]|nr:PQQ-dependent sugar dehydrogenase [Vicinamibacterales bacterium]
MPLTRSPLPIRAVLWLSIVMAWVPPRPATAQDSTHLRATVLVSGLTAPVAFVQDPVQPNVQYVVEQFGRIRVVQDGHLLAGDFIDLSGAIAAGGEQGLLGLAFAPDYATSRRFFVNFTNPSGNTVIARFLRSASDPLRADASSRFDLRWPDGNRFITQPFANHNGGDLLFGSDGFLYVGMGDGGSGNDPLNFAQNPMSLLGKVLRVDASVPDSDPNGYSVPFNNPFVGNGAFLPEIWALGLRNPFRFTVDAIAEGGSGALVIGDVGQNLWEEVDFDPFGRGGRNYGWRNREGAHDNVTTLPPATLPLIDPITEYSHADGNVITGGVVYRGSALGIGFFGRYFFADFGSGRLWSVYLVLNPATGEAVASGKTEHTLGMPIGNVSAFGVDASCEVYLVDYGGGRLLRIDPIAAPAGSGCATPDPFLSLGGGAWVDGGWAPLGSPMAAGAGQIEPAPTAATSGTGTPQATACVIPMPGSDWICVNGGWVPPGSPLAVDGSSGTGGSVTSGGTTGSPACTTPMPGANWVCVNGGWVPPDSPLVVGSGSGSGGSPPPPTACTIPDPFVGIPGLVGVCVNGGWVPKIAG